MEELFDSLKNWGCDVDGALARFIGDRELYRRCLHTAAGDQNFELLPEALRAGETARECECHAKTVYGRGECVFTEWTGCIFMALDAQGKLLQSGRGRTAPAAFFV